MGMVDPNGQDIQNPVSETQSHNLSEWSNEPNVEELKRDLEACRPHHGAMIDLIREWNDLLHVRGAEKPRKIKGRSEVQPKLIRRQAEWRYSALTEPFLSSDKIFKVDPATFEDVDAARQNGLVINWQFRTKMNRVQFIDNYVRSTVDDGTCIVRVSWKRATVQVKQQVPVWTHYAMQDEQSAQTLQQAIALKGENPRAYNDQVPPEVQQAVSYYEEHQIPTTVQQTGTQEVMVEKVLENRPTLEVLDPYNVFIDPSCLGNLDRAMFCIISFETCKADLLKEGKRYKNLNQVNWASSSPSTEPDHESKTPPDFVLADEARRRIVAFEYWGWWDMESDGVLVPFVATWIGGTMIRMEKNPYPDEKLPIVLVPYMPKKRDLYGEPDAELLKDDQKILGAVTRGSIDLLGRSANGQQGIAKGLLDPTNRRKYEDGKDYEFNPQQNPASSIIEHKYPEMPNSVLQMMQMVNSDAEALTGVKSFSGGLSGDAYGKTVGNGNDVIDAASTREMAILRRLAKGMTEIGTKIIAMNSEFLSEEETVRVTNQEFVKVKREDLKGNFDLIVDISTPAADAAKAQDLAFLLQTCGPNAGPDIMMMIMADIAELKRMPALAQKLRTYKPPPPTPEQQEMQQLQLEEQKLKVQKIQAEIALLGSKAGEVSSKKDLMDLDYVEQESGTKHARDMQKQGAQGQANQNLAVTKALTTPTKPDQKAPNIDAAVGFNALSAKMGEVSHAQPNNPIGVGAAS